MNIAVIGPGLIGTSIVLAARRAWPDVRVVQIDRGESLDAAADAEVAVLSAPVDVIVDVLQRQAPRLTQPVVIDTGSTKRDIVAAARRAGLATFVGGHPMAGAASAGPAAARADLFDGTPWFLVPADAVASAVAGATAFVEALGARPVVWNDDGREHDRVMAAVSHLPQVVASLLMTIVGDAVSQQDFQWAGAGLRDTTRLAASSAAMWESVLATNADQVQPLLRRMAESLVDIANRLDDPAAVRRVFEAANQYRARLSPPAPRSGG